MTIEDDKKGVISPDEASAQLMSTNPNIQTETPRPTVSGPQPRRNLAETFLNRERGIAENIERIELGQDEQALVNSDSEPEIDNLEREPNELERDNMPESAFSTKYALEAVPKFSGREPVQFFLEGCEEAKKMIKPEWEEEFTQILRNKLIGEARRAIYGEDIRTIDELTEFIKRIYSPSKSRYQLQGEMGCIMQGAQESVIAYTNRVKELAEQIKAAHNFEGDERILNEATKKQYDDEFKECLIRGLRSEIEQRVKKDSDFKGTIESAILIEKELEAKEKLRNPRQSMFRNNYRVNHIQNNQSPESQLRCHLCKKTGHVVTNCQFKYQQQNEGNLNKTGPGGFQQYTGNSRNGNYKKICNYCKKPGHWLAECRKREYNNAHNNNYNRSQTFMGRENRNVPNTKESFNRSAQGQYTPPAFVGSSHQNAVQGNFPRPPPNGANRENGQERPVLHIQAVGETEVPDWQQLI